MFVPVADDGSARVWGSVVDGVFEGVIDSPRLGRYYVERSHKYFPSSDGAVHSVMYHEDEVRDPYAHQRTGHSSGCGVTDEVVDWMRSVQESAVDEPESSAAASSNDIYNLDEEEQAEFNDYVSPNLRSSDPGLYSKYKRLYSKLHTDYHNKYSEEANKRSRRSISSGGVGEDNKGTCTLSIQTDPLLWRYIYQQVSARCRAKRILLDDDLMSFANSFIISLIYSSTCN